MPSANSRNTNEPLGPSILTSRPGDALLSVRSNAVSRMRVAAVRSRSTWCAGKRECPRVTLRVGFGRGQQSEMNRLPGAKFETCRFRGTKGHGCVPQGPSFF